MTDRRTTYAVLLASTLFLAFQWAVVGLLAAQVLMVVLFLLLFFAHSASRRLALALLPFVVFEVCYDWMRLFPNYMVRPIDVCGLYEAEVALFGIAAPGGAHETLCEYFARHTTPAADLIAGLCYLCWVPGPMAVGLWLYFTGHRRAYLHFALSFLVVNWLGFAIYYVHPAAPPWYVMQHGFDPIVGTQGSAAGLSRFDELVGVPVFSSIYVNNSNIFAALPSLHAAYMLVATIYARHTLRSPSRRRLLRWAGIALCAAVTMGIWWAAVYTAHHYVIDVLLGIATAVAGVGLFECLLMRIPVVRRGVDRYLALVAQSPCPPGEHERLPKQ